MPCRSGCPTQDHKSWGECACASVHFSPWYTSDAKKGKAWNGELAEYRQAVSQGIQPASTKTKDIRAAVALSNAADKPFNAATGGFDG